MSSHTSYKILSASIIAIAIAVVSCRNSNVEKADVKKTEGTTQTAPATATPQNASPHGAATGAVTNAAGVSWSVPASWKPGGEKPMRVASYSFGPEGKEADCAVFYFGPGQGGAVDANVDRWIGQFAQPDGSPSNKVAKIDHHTIAGLKVTTVDLPGIYMSSSMGGPMSGKPEQHPGYRLLGAIVEAPEGPVFFKITGPEQTIIQALDDFQQLVESVKKL